MCVNIILLLFTWLVFEGGRDSVILEGRLQGWGVHEKKIPMMLNLRLNVPVL